MDIFDNGNSKKKWIIGGITALVILLITLVIIFWDNLPFTPKPEQDEDSPTPPEDYFPTYPGGKFNIHRTDDGFIIDKNQTYVIPNEKTKVSEVLALEDEGVQLVLTVKNQDGTLAKYAIKYDTIVFDAKEKNIILSSKVNGKKGVTFLSRTIKKKEEGVSKTKQDVSLADLNKGKSDTNGKNTVDSVNKETKIQDNIPSHEITAVIFNEPDNLHYSPLMSMEKTEDYVYILNLETKTRYKAHRDTKIVNVLNGLQMSENELMFGDRLFIYEGDMVPKYKMPIEEDDFLSPSLVEELTSKDGVNGQYFKLTKEKDLLSKDFKTVEVAEIYVYPHTAP